MWEKNLSITHQNHQGIPSVKYSPYECCTGGAVLWIALPVSFLVPLEGTARQLFWDGFNLDKRYWLCCDCDKKKKKKVEKWCFLFVFPKLHLCAFAKMHAFACKSQKEHHMTLIYDNSCLWGWGTRAPLSPQNTVPGEAERTWRQVLHAEGNFFLNSSTVPSPTLNYFSRLGQRTRISSIGVT